MCDRIQIDNTTCANVCVCRALVEGEECPALAQLSKHVPISCLSAPSVKKELSVSYLGFFLTAPHTIISHRPLRGSTWERPSRPLFRPDKCLPGDGQTCLGVFWEKDGESLCFSSSSRSTCVAQFWDDEIVLVSKLVSVKKKKVVDFLQIQLWFSCVFPRLTFFSEDAVYSQQCRSHTGLTALLSPPSPSPLLFLTSPACVCVHKVSHWMMCVVSARGISSSNIDHW